MGPHGRTRLLFAALAALAAATLLAAPVASADLLSPESSGGSRNAEEINSLYWITFALALIVFLGVEGVLLYCIVKFRARRGAVAAQIRGNTRLEIGWTVGAAVILVVLATVTFAKLGDIRDPENSSPNGFQVAASSGVQYATTERRLPPDGRSLNIEVNGQQYLWRYTYADGDDDQLNDVFAYTQMVVPTGTTVTLDIRAQDVIHSWWIPDLGGKQDAVPGYTNHTWFKIDDEGVYRGQCAELCGRNHANMVAAVVAVSPPEFERWLASRRRAIQQADDAAAQTRRELESETDGEEVTP